ncbi:hypothetical protein SAMN05877842_11084 [Ureibacillus acetophenoni]|uniref:Uncharacterized protein n=1 Tax=Ureibacillus acetophenoni TaxID=614649 RepID=A0A285UI73_9BACL|nr:hypothetical protein SAMN05877842_11084 [Ureibacillus acetophenoni]
MLKAASAVYGEFLKIEDEVQFNLVSMKIQVK